MKESTLAPSFVVLYPTLCEVAQHLGYALAIHGSLQRDMDLIAVPWTDEARPAVELVWRIKEVCHGYIVGGRDGRDPAQKPHGRLAWSIHLDAGNYIDLSVMPRVEGE